MDTIRAFSRGFRPMTSSSEEHVLSEALQLRLDEASVAEKEALARKAAAEADEKVAEIGKAAADAHAAQLKAVVPDLTSVARGELKTPDDKALVATTLAYEAMRAAGAAV